MQKNRLGLSLMFILLNVIVFANGNQEELEPFRGADEGQRTEIILDPGPYYSKKVNYIVFSYTVQPQVAIWLESTEGDYIKTLYVTRVVGDQDFKAAPKEGRPAALPVWSHISERSIDAVSSSTIKEGKMSYGNSIDRNLKPGNYIVKLETNRSYDWNEIYTKKSTGVNGQPSLIYQAELDINDEENEALFEILGRGDIDGNNGDIKPDLDGITTAYQLFSSMRIRYYPE